ncbi:MAG TPA: plastocyanin/azurin family copper-binding protein [Sporichthya sp.]|nr:plastocyanin/azurin family copper-binding protein [Sporichthya sp.]
MRNVLSSRRTWTRGMSVSALVLGMAAVSPTQAGAQDSRTLAAQHAVTQKNLQFNPYEMSIAVGDTVTWTNHEVDQSTIHSVVQSGGSEINSPDIPPETSFSWTFTTAQDYNIVCRFHPDMFMTLHVLPAPAAPAAAKGAKEVPDKKAGDTKKSADKSANKSVNRKAPDKAPEKAPQGPAGPSAPMADHDGHEASAAKSVPAPPPGPPDSTIPGVAGLPFSFQSSPQR